MQKSINLFEEVKMNFIVNLLHSLIDAQMSQLILQYLNCREDLIVIR